MKTSHIFVFALVVLTVNAVQACSIINDYYLSLSNDKLWALVTGGSRIGKCFVQEGGGFCDLYAKAAERGTDGDTGYPKAVVNGGRVGTGCVKAPDFPKRRSTCYFTDPRYGLPSDVVSSFCTEKGRDNAVALMRHALLNDKCGLCQ